MNEIKSVEILPKVVVYKGLLNNPEELYRIMKQSEKDGDGRFYLKKWEKWSVFGTYTQEKHDIREEREFGLRYDEEKTLSDSIKAAYDIAIADYIKNNNVVLPESSAFITSSYSKYDPDIDSMKNDMTMQYHTDYIIAEKDMPGPKFFLTTTMYINDDYDGGDVEFFVDEKYYPYKPEAGDILIFPSSEPYFHGVKTIKNGNKFFIRNFIQYYYEGSEEWLRNQRYFGAVNWMKKETERIEAETRNNMRYSDRKNTQ